MVDLDSRAMCLVCCLVCCLVSGHSAWVSPRSPKSASSSGRSSVAPSAASVGSAAIAAATRVRSRHWRRAVAISSIFPHWRRTVAIAPVNTAGRMSSIVALPTRVVTHAIYQKYIYPGSTYPMRRNNVALGTNRVKRLGHSNNNELPS